MGLGHPVASNRMARPKTETTRAAFLEATAAAPADARVPVVVSLRADPFEAYRRARGSVPSFFFETGGGRPGWGYFGVEPDQFTAVGAGPAIDDGPALPALRALLADQTLARGSCEVPYPGGYFGWLSYDLARTLESLPERALDDRGLPALQLGRYPTVAAWREPHDGEADLLVVSSPRVADDPDAAYERGRDRARALAGAALDGNPTVGAPPASARQVAFARTVDRAGYAERVRRVKRYIRAGETFQANVSHRLEAPAAVHPVTAYASVREVNPAPYAGLLEFPGVDLVGASPELLLRSDGETVVTEPIAGTRPRGRTAAADRRLERELRADEKERAEHAMLVDLERNDLGRVCAYGSVAVDEYRRVDRYAAVMHLVSVVSGRLRRGSDVVDAIGAVFPGGTVTGAPKPRTMAIIEEVERTRRGPYTGSMAALGFDGRATLNVVIRTLVRHRDRYHLRVGGGVVHDSDPEREYEETLDKARALERALASAGPAAGGDRTGGSDRTGGGDRTRGSEERGRRGAG